MYGIYGIFNTTKEKWYVGQYENVSDRLSQHKSHLKYGTHHCKEMQNDFTNGDNFVFTVLEAEPKFEKYQLNDKENYYITKLSINGKYSGYNKIINTKSQGKAMRYIRRSDRTIKEEINEINIDYHNDQGVDFELYMNAVKSFSEQAQNYNKIVILYEELVKRLRKDIIFWEEQAKLAGESYTQAEERFSKQLELTNNYVTLLYQSLGAQIILKEENKKISTELAELKKTRQTKQGLLKSFFNKEKKGA